MNILDVCIVDIVSEEHLKRTVKVTMDVDCWGDKSRVTGGFLKADWEKYKHDKEYPEGRLLSDACVSYFENLSDDEWYEKKFSAKLANFSDKEILQEVKQRSKNLRFRTKLLGQLLDEERQKECFL